MHCKTGADYLKFRRSFCDAQLEQSMECKTIL